MERADALGAANVVIALFAVLEQVAPLQRPVIDKFGAFEQGVDQLRSPRGVLARQELANFSRSRQRADGVEIDTTGKFLIGT